ncbi:MAG: ribonuclease III [Pseudomonadota bacterium]
MNSEILGYQFSNSLLLEEALTHPSAAINNKNFTYERLEFLGDAVLGLVIAEMLLTQFPNEDEGKLAKRRSALISGENLSKIARKLGIGERIIMTEAEKKSGGQDNDSNLENALEAIIGAIYLDGNIDKLKIIIKNIWQEYIDEMLEVPFDPKSKLQEILQKNGKPLPIYELMESFGPKHMLTFKVKLRASGYDDIISEGRTKQIAEKLAASNLLKLMENL